jgi:ribonuclease P protein component
MTSPKSFPKTERLRRAEEFRDAIRNSRVFREDGVLLYCSPAKESGINRLGILVSRRAIKRATERNRIKRLIREFFRMHKKQFSASFDLIVRILGSDKLLELNNLEIVLNQLFARAGILK